MGCDLGNTNYQGDAIGSPFCGGFTITIVDTQCFIVCYVSFQHQADLLISRILKTGFSESDPLNIG